MLKFSEEIKGKVFHRDSDDVFIIFTELYGEEAIYFMESDKKIPSKVYPLSGFIHSMTQKDHIWGLSSSNEITLSALLLGKYDSSVFNKDDILFDLYKFDDSYNLNLVNDKFTNSSTSIKGSKFINYIFKNIIDTRGVPLSEIN